MHSEGTWGEENPDAYKSLESGMAVCCNPPNTIALCPSVLF